MKQTNNNEKISGVTIAVIIIAFVVSFMAIGGCTLGNKITNNLYPCDTDSSKGKPQNVNIYIEKRSDEKDKRILQK